MTPSQTHIDSDNRFLTRYWTMIEVFLIGVAVVFLLMGGVAIVYVIFDIPFAAGTEEVELSLPFNLALVALNALAFAVPVAAALWIKGRQDHPFGFGWRVPERSWFVMAAVLGTAVIFITNLIAYLVFELQDAEPVNPQLDLVVPEGFSWLGAVGMTIGVGILVPIAEELLFRGVIHRWLRQFLSFWPAVLLSSFIFGLLHIEPAIAAGAAVLGGICAWIYERSESIWPAVIIHFINNASKVVLIYWLLALEV